MNLSGALAKDTHRVRATLSSAPLANSSANPGDALNRATWTVTNNVTSVSLFVLQVLQITSTTFDIFVASDMTTDQFTLACPTLLDSTGALITAPTSQVFTGIALAIPPTPQGAGQSLPVDLKNAVVQGLNTIGGTLVIGQDGDYVFESGESLLKKLILRRLTTAPGAFFNLPTYGFGLQEKSLVRPAGLLPLKRQIEQQVAQEPELQDVAVSILLVTGTGLLQVTVLGTIIRTGQPFSVTTKLSIAA